MWSLPDIIRLNEEAARDAKQNRFEDEVARPESHCCEVCGWEGNETPANYGYLWFDIFSDDAKGTIFLCENHDGYTGDPLEGYFTCEQCERVFINNYSWELYSSYLEEVGEVCLPCALKLYLAEESHWIDPQAVERVILYPDGEELFEGGTLNLAKARHLIGVEMPVPPAITFIQNLEFDACTGQMLATFSSTYPAGVGEAAALQAIEELAEEGYFRFLPILDAAYQFSISIGLYVDTAEHEAIVPGGKKVVAGGKTNGVRGGEDGQK